MVKYCRLTREERYQIEALLRSGQGVRQIAVQLGRAPSTICREIRTCTGNYQAGVSDRRSQDLRRQPHPELRKIQGMLKYYVDQRLRMDWSPEQIGGRLHQSGKTTVSHQTIYRYIQADQRIGGKLIKHLRILRKQRRDGSPPYRPTRLEGRLRIEQRPPIVAQRNRLGDYERDSLLGKAKGPFLLTMVDRTSRKTKICKIRRKCSRLVHRATVARLKNEPLHTLTNDNGTEFSRHRETAKALGIKVYFANSYRAWERGTNENINGLLRQYLPRKKDLGWINFWELRQIENRLNNRPRKCLGFRTPNEVHNALKASLLR